MNHIKDVKEEIVDQQSTKDIQITRIKLLLFLENGKNYPIYEYSLKINGVCYVFVYDPVEKTYSDTAANSAYEEWYPTESFLSLLRENNIYIGLKMTDVSCLFKTFRDYLEYIKPIDQIETIIRVWEESSENDHITLDVQKILT